MNENFQSTLAALSEPFGADVIQWKPGATTKDKTRALALPYVDSREYIRRLNQVVGDWQDEYQAVALDGRVGMICRLTVGGVTRTGDGECDLDDANAITSASAQAFKRACVKFGLGAYLYDIPQVWADYDAERKRFSDEALHDLEVFLRTGEVPPRRSRGRSAAAPQQGQGQKASSPPPRAQGQQPGGNGGSGKTSQPRAQGQQPRPASAPPASKAPQARTPGGNGKQPQVAGRARASSAPF